MKKKNLGASLILFNMEQENTDNIIIFEISSGNNKMKLPYDTKIKDIANKIAILIYGKYLKECIGKPQNILKKKLKNYDIRVYLPTDTTESKNKILKKSLKSKNNDNTKYKIKKKFFYRNNQKK